MTDLIPGKAWQTKGAEMTGSHLAIICASGCEFEIPGVGRIRTGQKHANFHATEIIPKEEVGNEIGMTVEEKEPLLIKQG
jgi:hypothetical protein